MKIVLETLEDKNYQMKIRRELTLMRQNSYLCDLFLIVSGILFELHRNVLAGSSRFFEKMLTSDFKEKKMDIITMDNIDSNIFESLVDYMYSGEIKINNQNAKKLLISSDFLEILDVTKASANYLTKQLINEIRNERHERTFFDILEIRYIANLLKFNRLFDVCNKFIAFNLEYFEKSNEFLSINYNQLFDLMKCDQIFAYCTEETTRNACMRWLTYDKNERMPKTDEILSLTRFREHYPRQIFAIGGKHNNGSVEIYEIIKEEWRKIGRIPIPKFCMGTAVVNNDIYLLGGGSVGSHTIALNEVQVFNKETQQLSQRCSMSTSRCCPAVAVLDDVIYVCGGRANFNIEKSVECYNPRTDTWKYVQPMINDRQSASAVTLNGIIYVLGGKNQNFETLNSVERFDITTNSWEYVAPMKHKRGDFGATVYQGNIYVCGGINEKYHVLNSVEIYDPIHDNWIEAPSMNTKRACFAFLFAQKFFAFGGISNVSDIGNANQALNSVEMYDPETKVWTYEESMLEKRHCHSAAVF